MKTQKFPFISLIIVTSVLIVAAGYYFIRNEETRIKAEKFNELKAIADLKANQLVQWRNERLSEVNFFSKNQDILHNINKLFQGEQAVKKNLQATLSHILSNNRYENIFIINKKDDLLFSLDSNFIIIDTITLSLSLDVVKNEQVQFSDFYYCSTHHKIHLDIIAPIVISGKIVGTMVFRIDPEAFLYPYIQDWPTPSKSVETLLVSREGDSVIFLNRLRHANFEPVTLKIPIIDTIVPAVRAVLGIDGFFDGVDYRGIKVISKILDIPDSPWFMVAKVDKDEVFSELYRRSFYIGIITIILVLLVGTVITWFYHYRQRNIYRKLFENEIELHQSQEEFRATLYSIGDGVITTDKRGIVKQLNPVAEKLTGWQEKDAHGKELEYIFKIVNEFTREKVENPVDKVLKEGLIVGLANHTLLISKNGKEIPIADSGAPIKDKKGNIIGVVLVFSDKSEERVYLNALRESEERFIKLFEKAPLGYQSLNENGFFIEVNEAWLETLGYEKDEVIDRWFGDFLAPEYVDSFKERFPFFKKQGKIHSEFEMIHKNGERRFIAFDGRIGYKNDGSFDKTHCILQDITIQKSYDQKLRDSEERIRLLLNSTAEGIYGLDNKGNCTFCNKAALEFLGYSDESELIGKNMHNQIHSKYIDGSDFPVEECRIFKAFEQGKGAHVDDEVLWKKNGEYFPAEYWSYPIIKENKIIGSVVTFIDITERKRGEIERFKLLNIIENSINEIYVIDAITLRFEYLNRGALSNLGYTLDEIRELTPVDLNSEITTQKFFEIINPLLNGEEEVQVIQSYHKRKNGSTYPIEAHFQLQELDSHKIFLAVVNDISERKKTEETLRASEEKLSNILNNITDVVWSLSWPDLKPEYLSPSVEKLYGRSIQEFIDKPTLFIEIVHPDDQSLVDDAFKQLQAKGVAVRECRIIRPDGSITWIHDKSQLIFDDKNQPIRVEGIAQDITDRKRAEEAQQAERQRLHNLLEVMPMMVCLLTPDYHVPFANRAFREKFGEANGRRCYEYCYGKNEPCDFCESFKVLETGRPHRWEVSTPDGTSFLDAYNFPFSDMDGSPMILEVDVDITESKLAQIELIKLKESLEEKVNEKTKELKDRIDELERYKDATIDRELRMKELRDEIKRLKMNL